jgi:hypothetical protein
MKQGGDMEKQVHPTFETTFKKLFFSSWLSCVSGAGGIVYFSRHDHGTLPVLIFSALAMVGLGCFAYLIYRFYRVSCCACNRMAKTRKDATQTKWVAVCRHCHIEWDLKIGVGGD